MSEKSFIEKELDREARLRHKFDNIRETAKRRGISRNKAITTALAASRLGIEPYHDDFEVEQHKNFDLTAIYSRCIALSLDGKSGVKKEEIQMEHIYEIITDRGEYNV